jgi:hypothetical protein
MLVLRLIQCAWRPLAALMRETEQLFERIPPPPFL